MGSSTPLAPKVNWLVSMGDSMTCSDNTLSIPKTQQYCYLVKSAIGGYCREINLGVPGNTSTQMLARISDMVKRGVPQVATIYSGINDLANSIVPATTQSNLQAMVDYLKTAGCQRIMLMNIHNTAATSDDANFDPYRTVIQTVATSNGSSVVFCDLHAVALSNPSDYNGASVHLVPAGLQKLANKIKTDLDALGWSDVLKK